MDSFNDVMDAVKAYCKGRVSDASYRVFIQDLNLLNFEGTNIIILEVPNDVVMRFAAARYADLLKEAFASILGFEVELKFVLAAPAPDGGKAAEKPKLDENDLPSGRYEFTFENFIKGPSNQFAFAAAQAVAANPSGAYNPLFIYGPSGLGKTHLLNAIKIEIQKNHPDFNIVYVDCEKFTNETITAIKTATMEQFRQRYRKADVLLIDDIQFLAGKESTQEEFFHTFNTLYESGKQIVLTSDRPPREMTQLEDRLRTRFEWGLMVDVAPPDFETRLAIIQNKAAALGVKLPAEVSDYIAENVTSNVRQLEGTLNKILAYRDLLGDQVDEEAVGRAVRDMLLKSNEYVPSPKIIISYVAKYYHLDEDTIRGQSRGRDVVTARQVAIYLIRRMNGLPMNDIGKEFSNRDHTTILHSLQKVEQQMQSDPVFAERVKEITTNINNKR